MVGAAAVDITPPPGLPYLAWKPRHKPFSGVHDRLFVRSAVITACGETVAILSADSIGFNNHILGPGRDFTSEVRKRIQNRTGIPEKNIMLLSSHIHSAPETIGFRPVHDDPEMMGWLEAVMEGMAECAGRATAGLFEAVLRSGVGSVPGISYNRDGFDAMDPRLTVLEFKGIHDGRNIVFIHYACHPVIMQVQDSVSADFVGVLAHAVKSAVPGNEACLFLQGACGDIDPVKASSRNFIDAFEAGTAIATHAVSLIGSAGFVESHVHPARLKTARRKVLFPSRPLPVAGEREEALRKFEAFCRDPQNTLPDDAFFDLEEECFRYMEGDAPLAGELQAFRIGDLMLFGIPGEPFCELGLWVRENAAPLTGVPLGYANGYLGYIVPEQAWQCPDCYETSLGMWSRVGPDAVEIIQEAFLDMRKELLQ